MTTGLPSFPQFLDSVAAKTPTPGGGAVASAVGALSAALASMVTAYSIGKKNLADHQPWLTEAQTRLTRARALMLTLSDEDEAAYGLVNELMKLPAGDARRERELPAATRAAVAVPMALMAASVDVLRLYLDLAERSNRMLRSDLGIAAELALATARSCRWNVAINADSLPETEKAATLAQADTLDRAAAELRDKVAHACCI